MMLLDKQGIETRLIERLDPSYFEDKTTLMDGLRTGAMHSAITHEPITTYYLLSKERHGVSSLIQNMSMTNKEPTSYWVTVGPYVAMSLEENAFGVGHDAAIFMTPNVLRATQVGYATETLMQIVNALGAASDKTRMNVFFKMERDEDGAYRVNSVRHDGEVHSHRFPFERDIISVRLNLVTGEFDS